MDGARGYCDANSHPKEPAPKQGRGDTMEALGSRDENIKKLYFWKRMRRTCKHQADDDYDDGPDCVEVYEFERGCEALVSRNAGQVSLVERAARRAARPAAGLLNELLAVPRLAFAATLYVALQLQRCALLSVREAVTGTVQTTVDVLVKPMLALAFNAVLRPPLVCLAQTAMAIREALRPLSLALTDAMQPLASLLSAVRLVQVESQYTWPCIQHV